jgi:hypothetical protein
MIGTEAAVFIRTNAFTPQVAQLAESLSVGFAVEVILICDERLGAIDTAGYRKISLTDALVQSFNLSCEPKNWGWLCGDFCHYAARTIVPDADWYVVIENDVFMTPTSGQKLSTHLSQTKADALACGLGYTDTAKTYSRELEHFGITSKCGCIFAVTCLRGHVIDKMLTLRQRAQRDGKAQINDEAVLAGTLIQDGLPSEDLFQSLPELFSSQYFETNPPHLYEAMPLSDVSEIVVHPTIPLAIILERIEAGEKNYSRHRLRKVLQEAPRKIRQQIKAALAARQAK